MAEVKKRERIIRLSRRVNVPRWQKILITTGTILFAFLLCGLISTMVAPGSFVNFYKFMIDGTFKTPKIFFNLLWQSALLFLIAMALTPAFKMKFWNIGAEGQCLMGGLGALIAMKFIAPNLGGLNFIAILIELLFAVAFAAIWGLIPAFFKAQFNTNETLFTLMMNYIAMGLVASCVIAWSTSGSNVLGVVNSDSHAGWLPYVGSFGNSYILNVIIIAVVAIIVWVYLSFSKHGYELAVVGGSRNTAKYVGIDVKLVIIRTMVLSGALCGIAGFLMVAGASHTVSENLAGGRGFTAILVSWLGGFSVPIMALYSFLVTLVSVGSSSAAQWIGYSSTVSSVVTGLFFLLVIGSTFFINFNVHIRFPKRKKIDETLAVENVVPVSEEKEDK